jgi:hypothetical protein
MAFISSITRFIERHGKHFLTVAFFAGFVVDYFTLPDISNKWYPYIGLVYASIVGLTILLKEWQLHLFAKGRGSKKFQNIVNIVLSFQLGSLLSYVFIYYVRGGDMFTNWPLYLFLLTCVFFNELSLSHSAKVVLNTTLLFVAIVFYLIFNTPLYYKEVSDQVFIRSIIFSILVCYLYAAILALFLYNQKLAHKIYIVAFAVPLLIGSLYFVNIIPAVPLALKDAALYSSVARTSAGEYDFVDVRKTAQTYLGFGEKEIVYSSGRPLYFYAAVIAPAAVQSSISHTWQIYNSTTEKWDTVQKVEFPIVGGRKEGYRGYSILPYTEQGMYRVIVEVGSKRFIGQKVFRVSNNV